MDKINPSISIIVPVYKAETYLHRCVDSLLAQTFTDFEVLLIDDGSPDRSGEICDDYAHKDARVRVFHQENGGVSVARQRGLDEARGEYTIHADPDDWVEPDMLEALYRKAKEDDADMVICDYYTNDGKVQKYVRQRPSKLDHCTVLHELFQQLHGSCWNKLVKRVCYSRYGVRFPEDLSLCEDLYVNSALLLHDIRVTYVKRAFYHYNQIEGSISNTYSSADIKYLTQLKEKFAELFSELTDISFASDSFDRNILRSAFWGHYLSNKLFNEKFGDYKWEQLKAFAFPMSIMYYLSCHGFYAIIYAIANALKNKR